MPVSMITGGGEAKAMATKQKNLKLLPRRSWPTF